MKRNRKDPEAHRLAQAHLEKEKAKASLEELMAIARRASRAVKQGTLARQAYYDFGKGRHKAGLHFGDCFAYALAKALGEPLLFNGNDFSRTDVQVAAGGRQK